MTANDFKKTILAQMDALLKPMGFRRKDMSFSADVNDVVLFVQLQSSTYKTTKDRLVATVNLGIFSRTLAERLGNTHAPNILEAHWKKRIGLFVPAKNDKWWEISNDGEAELCASEITNVLESYALPEMQTLASTESLESLWKTGENTLSEFERKQYLAALSDSASNRA